MGVAGERDGPAQTARKPTFDGAAFAGETKDLTGSVRMQGQLAQAEVDFGSDGHELFSESLRVDNVTVLVEQAEFAVVCQPGCPQHNNFVDLQWIERLDGIQTNAREMRVHEQRLLGNPTADQQSQ